MNGRDEEANGGVVEACGASSSQPRVVSRGARLIICGAMPTTTVAPFSTYMYTPHDPD